MAYTLQARGVAAGFSETFLGRVTTVPVGSPERADAVFLNPSPGLDLRGYSGVLVGKGLPFPTPVTSPIVHELGCWDHLAEGDVVSVLPTGYVRTLYKQASIHNSIFATDRCNSFCLMCSQPPKKVDDSGRIREHLRLLDLIRPAPSNLGITGGEPTLFGRDFIRLIAACKERLPTTNLQVLTNGRLFAYRRFCEDLAAVKHQNLVLGIPLYSDLDYEHDFVVQARGAFTETVRGLLQLAEQGVRIEIRVVVHRLTYQRLGPLAEFIYRNLTFADHVALMGLEAIGFAVPNLEALWIDPVEYGGQLSDATKFLAARGMNVSIYNHQLCTVPRDLWPYCRQSISDWKNEYVAECQGCSVRTECGGFFTSGVRRRISSHIAAIAG